MAHIRKGCFGNSRAPTVSGRTITLLVDPCSFHLLGLMPWLFCARRSEWHSDPGRWMARGFRLAAAVVSGLAEAQVRY